MESVLDPGFDQNISIHWEEFCLANLSTFLDSFDLSEALVKTFNLQHNTAQLTGVGDDL